MKISVIIPVLNNLSLTIQCLESLAVNSRYLSDSEWIIIDDGSEDGTQEFFAGYCKSHPRVVYHRNPVNQKFARSCNTGASLAAGDFLVFLNNDTMVDKDWDLFLLEPLMGDRDTWMTGAKLLYPDLTLQHAGVYIPELTGKSFAHVYRGLPSWFPPANRAKYLQCVTAACMMMRKDDFMELGGFDTVYLNGLEDVDLCMRVIEKGGKIFYQPKCTVIHFESRSEGRYANSAQNASLFHAKWASKVVPDMAEMIKSDLHHGTEAGELFLAGQSRPGSFVISKPVTEHIPIDHRFREDHLLIILECEASERAEVRLRAQTRSGYDDPALFDPPQVINPGKNILMFNVNMPWVSGQPRLVFTGEKARIDRSSLAAYAYKNPVAGTPIIAVCHHASDMPSAVIAGKWEGEPDFTLTFTVMDENFSLSELNASLSGKKPDYLLLIGKGMSVNPNFMLQAVEIMECLPKTGFVYSDASYGDEKAPSLIKNDFNPATVLKSGVTDFAGMVRKKAWEGAGGFDPAIRRFPILELMLNIKASGSWTGYKISYPAFHLRDLSFDPSFDYVAERGRVRAKYAGFLLHECVRMMSRERHSQHKSTPEGIKSRNSFLDKCQHALFHFFRIKR